MKRLTREDVLGILGNLHPDDISLIIVKLNSKRWLIAEEVQGDDHLANDADADLNKDADAVATIRFREAGSGFNVKNPDRSW